MAGDNENNSDRNPDLNLVLNEDDASRWPAVWRAPGLEDLSIDPEIEAKILADIRERFPAKRKPPLKLYLGGGLAAAAAILLAVFVFRGDFGGPATIATIANASRAELTGKKIRAGESLATGPGEFVFLKYGGEYALRLAGPAQVTFATGERRLDMTRGRLTLRSLRSNIKPPLVLRTPALDYRVLGTMAELAIGEKGQSLVVLKGKMEARYKDNRASNPAPIQVEAGRKLELSRKEIAARARVEAAPAAPAELDTLRGREQELRERVKPSAGQSPQDPQGGDAGGTATNTITNTATATATTTTTPATPAKKKPPRRVVRKKLFTLGQLRAKYGSIHRVRLKNGRSYLGHMRIVDGMVEVYTEYGVKKFPRSRFKSAQEQ